MNPPVHAWAAWRVYKIDKKRTGRADRHFLEGVFHKLLLNFNWWVNRKDAEGMNVFQGGFLGLDNIGVFDRSAAAADGGHIEQSDGTSWMGMFSLNMLAIALELARENPAYEGVASKFFEHFVQIAHAMDSGRAVGAVPLGRGGRLLLRRPAPARTASIGTMKVRSLVGLIPLLAVETLEPDVVAAAPGLQAPHGVVHPEPPGVPRAPRGGGAPGRRACVGCCPSSRASELPRVLRLHAGRAASSCRPTGSARVSQYHRDHPYVLAVDGREYRVDYEPAESSTGLFGGNSNWRGPIWFPINYLLIEALQKFDHFYGPSSRSSARPGRASAPPSGTWRPSCRAG